MGYNYLREKNIQLVAVQAKVSIDDYKSEDSFKKMIENIMEKVFFRLEANIPTLVVFPEDIGTMTVLIYEKTSNVNISLKTAIKNVIYRNLPELFLLKIRYLLKGKNISLIKAMFLLKGDMMEKIYVNTFSDIAKKYRVFIVAGSTILPYTSYKVDKPEIFKKSYRKIVGNIYNTSYVFGPDGKIIGSQRKVHLIELEEATLGISPADLNEIDVVKTPIGNLGIAICYDAFHNDVLEILEKKGANILIQPSANPGPWNYEQQRDWLEGCYKAVVREKKFKYAINPMLIGKIFDLTFYGQSSILVNDEKQISNFLLLGPCKGIAKVAEKDDEEEILVFKIEIRE